MALTPDGRYFAIGREALPAPVETKTYYLRSRTSAEEECEHCGAVRLRNEMRFVDSDEDGPALYICADGCEAQEPLAP